jgi:RimJ/RimL family protein N-acetyltransferase
MPNDLRLRDVTGGDLPIFFEQQLDATANWMAAFTAKDPTDRAAFDTRWAKILADPDIVKQTIDVDGHVGGHIMSFEQDGVREICYWLGQEFWGRGIATCALGEFLMHVTTRPLYARVVKDNLASMRVLEKCGFMSCGTDRGFANARGEEVDEVIMMLAAPESGET